jgi:hypothetical protein
VPEPYWKIEPVITEKAKAYTLKWMRGKIYDRTVARIIHARIATITKAEVMDVKKQKVT